MRNLISFLVRHSSWFVFLLYAAISLFLLFNNNPYQQYVYLTSANRVTAAIYKCASSVTSYFNLQTINQDLQERNALLEMDIINLKRQLNDYKLLVANDSINLPDSVAQNYEYHFATVINNSVSKFENYITIDKGKADGIEPEMGVVDQNGVVGMVSTVGEHASMVISMLNPDMRLSCKVKNSDYFGSMYWDGSSPYFAVLSEMPRHVKYHRGDTIVTSGYSSVFPEGLIVGTIQGGLASKDGNFTSLKIRLSTDFTRLNTVRTIKSKLANELKALDKGKEEEQQ